MDEWMDYYKVLQVQHFADSEVVQAAYKKLCIKHHPDSAPNYDGGDMIRLLNRAYSVLKNDSSRKEYDIEWHRKNRLFVSGVQREAKSPHEDKFAKKIMSHYFTCISGKLYDDAYSLISDRDKVNIPVNHFVRWQMSVAGIYQLRHFQIVDSKPCEDFLIEGGYPSPAEQMKIIVHEENRSSSLTERYSMYKFAIFEKGRWRIYLGYRDVLSLSRRFLQQAS